MPNEKEIHRDIDGFAKILYDVISNGTQQGLEQLEQVFTQAEEKYKKGGRQHKRIDDFEKAKADIKKADTQTNVMQTILLFLKDPKGGWAENSANTCLMLGLIDASSHVRTSVETDKYLSDHVVMLLSKSLCELIATYVNDEVTQHKRAVLARKQLEAKREVKLESLPYVMLTDDLIVAKDAQASESEKKFIFCLRHINGKWELLWLDDLRRENQLPTSAPAFNSLLEKLDDYQLPHPNSEAFGRLKVCCNNLIKANSNIYLFGDGDGAAHFSKQYPEKKAFCLTCSDAKKWQLSWYDMQGKAHYLIVSNELTSLLSATEKCPTPDNLLYFKVKKECLKVFNGLLDKVQLQINPSSRSDQGLTSTFVLTHTSSDIVLYWYDSLGVGIEINCEEYPVLNDWLHRNKDLSEENLSELKTYLLHLKPRREIDEEKQQTLKEWMTKEHGITLVVQNTLSAIPRIQLIVGTYFLVREPAIIDGAWVLYQRVKGPRGASNERINTDIWETYHQILAENINKLPEELEPTTVAALKKCIANRHHIAALDSVLQNNTPTVSVNRLNMDNYGDLERVIGARSITKHSERPLPKKLDPSHYTSKVAVLFNHQPKLKLFESSEEGDETPTL